MKNFELAKPNNCDVSTGHVFIKLRNPEKIWDIRFVFPQLIFSLWRCDHCNKITEST